MNRVPLPVFSSSLNTISRATQRSPCLSTRITSVVLSSLPLLANRCSFRGTNRSLSTHISREW